MRGIPVCHCPLRKTLAEPVLTTLRQLNSQVWARVVLEGQVGWGTAIILKGLAMISTVRLHHAPGTLCLLNLVPFSIHVDPPPPR